MSFRIGAVHAFVQIDDDDEEGVCSVVLGGVRWPMVAADEMRLHLLRPHAERVARVTGKPVKLVRFDARTDLEEIQP